MFGSGLVAFVFSLFCWRNLCLPNPPTKDALISMEGAKCLKQPRLSNDENYWIFFNNSKSEKLFLNESTFRFFGVLLLKGQLEIKQNKNNTKKIIINKIKKKEIKLKVNIPVPALINHFLLKLVVWIFFVECILKGLPDLLRQTRVSCYSRPKEMFTFQGNEI